MASANRPPQQPDAGRQSLSPDIRNAPEESVSPRSAATKVVSIAEPESISPMMKGKSKEFDGSFDLDKTAKQYRANVGGKRLSGRSSIDRTTSSRRQSSVGTPTYDDSEPSSSRPQSRHSQDGLIAQVSAWLKQERARRASQKAKRHSAAQDTAKHPVAYGHSLAEQADRSGAARERRPSDSSEGSVALEHLADILEKNLSLVSNERPSQSRKPSHARRISSIMKLSKSYNAASSDTDYVDGDVVVPSCEAVLDNSKTLSYSGGAAESEQGIGSPGKNTPKEKEAWATFKFEIVRLTHTLRLKGWRRVPLERSNDIEVERLSGALTNAVYVVAPPKNLPLKRNEKGDTLPVPKNPPPKLLLRIYGPQVEHLIDRESELQILRRLARKRIGPRLLGTFTNGRFEEFFHARTLTPKDLRIPDTSKQIAKRMRELHEGIDLLPQERADGPFVWRNWDKWVERCEQIITWLDTQILENGKSRSNPRAEAWRKYGLICGVEWPVFRATVEKYRKWMDEQYGGAGMVNERLVFAHNDTQYGNILRLIPAGESPLLLPANEHKQLVVIDFEYASANLPGLEFANHFTEWCYNYHDPKSPHSCTTNLYPTPEEQRRFIRSYLLHNPTFKAGAASTPSTPGFGPTTPGFGPTTPSLRPTGLAGTPTALAATAAPSSSISSFMLDSRAPPTSYQESEEKAEKETEAEIERLMAETRLWRLANSAQWVAWGIVQAKIPGLPEWGSPKKEGTTAAAKELESALLEVKEAAKAEEEGKENAAASGEGANEEDEEFDYLGYAHERALFFWGDAVRLGIVKVEELPEGVQKQMKIVEY